MRVVLDLPHPGGRSQDKKMAYVRVTMVVYFALGALQNMCTYPEYSVAMSAVGAEQRVRELAVRRPRRSWEQQGRRASRCMQSLVDDGRVVRIHVRIIQRGDVLFSMITQEGTPIQADTVKQSAYLFVTKSALVITFFGISRLLNALL